MRVGPAVLRKGHDVREGRCTGGDPVPAVEWAGVNRFTIGMTERLVTKKRRVTVRGTRAIRVPQGRATR